MEALQVVVELVDVDVEELDVLANLICLVPTGAVCLRHFGATRLNIAPKMQ